MANRVLVGKRGSDYGVFVSKTSQNVLTCADNQLLFDSRKSRTGQIYAGASNLNFVEDSDDQEAYVRGTANLFFTAFSNGGNLTGKKIIIDGTTVTLSTTTTIAGQTYTSVDNMKTDINAASISGVTSFRSSLSSTDHRLGIRKTTADMVITYPTTNSLEAIVGIATGTYDYPELSNSGINYLTASGTTKPNLGYTPLIILSEQNSGVYELDDDGDESEYFETVSRVNLWRTTTTHMFPITADADLPAMNQSGYNYSRASNKATDVGPPTNIGRTYFDDDQDTLMTNASFFVLRIPCGYGYMNSTYFG